VGPALALAVAIFYASGVLRSLLGRRRRFVRSPRFFLLLLIPVGSCVAGFGGCSLSLTALGPGSGGASAAISSASGAGGGAAGGLAITVGGTGGAYGGGLSAACSTNADCGGALACLGPTMNDAIFGGGAPGGFCTKACLVNTDCGPGAVCYSNEPNQTGHCTLACTIGPPIPSVAGLFTPLLMGKCLARNEVRCAETSGDAGACLPTCSADDQCGGHACDPASAVCVVDAGAGLPTGVACDPSTTPTGCAGLCVTFMTPADVSICSRPCVLGGAGDSSPECGGPQNGLCAFHRDAFGAGDLGYCTLACTAHTDCLNPRFGCFTVPLLTPTSGKGYCFAANPCPDGQSDCTAPDLCTPTDAGPVCLEPTLPPDAGPDGGPDDAGTGDGGPGDGGIDDAGAADAGDAGLEDAGDAGNTSLGDAGKGDTDAGDAGQDETDAGDVDGGDGGDGGP
jgi:hypothetical protein